MKKKKIVLILTAAMMLESMASVFTFNSYAQEQSFPITYDFESGTQGWSLGEALYSPELTLETEEDNSFLRLTAKAGASYKNTDKITVIPNVYVEPEEPFVMEKNAQIVISADVRTNNIDSLVRTLMINRNMLEEPVKDEMQYNLATLWGWNKTNYVNTYEKNNTTLISGTSYNRVKTTNAFKDLLENNQWYNFKTIIETDDSGIAKSIRLEVLKDKEPVYEMEEKREIENTALKLSDKISRIDFALGNATVTLTEDAVFDIDNVKLYCVTNERYADIYGGVNNVFQNVDSISLKFNAAMDKTTLNNQTIVLYDDEENKVSYTAQYDENQFMYTLIPDNEFKSGKYIIKLDKANINGIGEDGGIIEGLSDSAKSSIEFTVFNGTLPAAKDVKISGRIRTGEILSAEAQYYQEENIPGHIEYQWYYSYNEDDEYFEITGASGKTFEIPDESYEDRFIRVAVTPVTEDGIKGETVYSDILRPLEKPYVKNAEIFGMAVIGMELSIEYDFYDDNGDNEAESIYKWYYSDEQNGDWKEINGAAEKTFIISDDMENKYIMAEVTPVSDDEPYEGMPVRTASIGPVVSQEGINLVKNTGFEDGNTSGWGVRNAGDSATITAVQGQAHSGNWCGLFSGQTSNSTFMTYNVKLDTGVKYITGAWMKLEESSTLDNASQLSFYGENYSAKVTKYNLGNNSINKSEWSLVSDIFMCTSGGTYSGCPQYWANDGTGYKVYIDDFYIGPLMVSEIDVLSAPSQINIPQSGETSSVIKYASIRNQLGTTMGLENETAFLEVDDDVSGVYVEGNTLYVTSDAVSGTVNVRLVCEPAFEGAVQSRYVKTIPVELIAHSNKTPQVKSVVLTGDTTNSAVLNLDYVFYQVDGNSDESKIQWFVSDSQNGEYTEITGETNKQLTVTEQYKNKYIKVIITPIDSEGNTSAAVTSNIAGPQQAPEARNVTVEGKGAVGDVMQGKYEYYDFNNDKESQTKLEWLKSDDKDGVYTAIDGANESSYTVKEDDAGCWFKFKVIPGAQNPPYSGEAVLSEAIPGPHAPTADNLSITSSGKVLTGKYEYHSVNETGEGDTKCEWLVDGKVVKTGTVYTVSFSGTKTVEFRVTPVAVKAPATGESVSVTKSVTGSTSGGSSGGGGGGGSGSVGGGSTSILPVVTTPVNNNNNTSQVKITDIEGHWANQYAYEAVNKSIMKVNSNNEFLPDKNVTRAEMIEYIFKAMEYTETDYKDEFGDVSKDAPYSGMLQTMVDKGIISKDIKFRPNDNVSREEVCKIISISLGLSNNGNELDGYTDIGLIGDWAVEYVKNLIASKIMTGVSDTEFSPKTNITNAQIAKIVCMIINDEYVVVSGKNEDDKTQQTNKYDGTQTTIDTSKDEFVVAFVGGSLTQLGEVWRNAVCDKLKEKMPDKNIIGINAGVGGTGSSYGTKRFYHDALSKNPDMVFIEFAINDMSSDEFNSTVYMDQMVIQALNAEKVPAVVFLFAPDPTSIVNDNMEKINNQVKWKTQVADHYNIKCINVYDYMKKDLEQQQSTNKDMTWDRYLSPLYTSTGDNTYDVHGGYEKYTQAIIEQIDNDYDAFLKTPKNVAPYCSENETGFEYKYISCDDSRITYNGEWTKHMEAFNDGDVNSVLTDANLLYFDNIMQSINPEEETSYEFTTDAKAVSFTHISSKAGMNADIYIDGEFAETMTTKSQAQNMDYDTKWYQLPDDGNKHEVKVVLSTPSQIEYVYSLGAIYEQY